MWVTFDLPQSVFAVAAERGNCCPFSRRWAVDDQLRKPDDDPRKVKKRNTSFTLVGTSKDPSRSRLYELEVFGMTPILPPLANADSGASRTSFEALQTRLGIVPNMYRTFAHATRILDAAVSMAQAIRTDLDPKLRELAYPKVVQLTDCHV